MRRGSSHRVFENALILSKDNNNEIDNNNNSNNKYNNSNIDSRVNIDKRKNIKGCWRWKLSWQILVLYL